MFSHIDTEKNIKPLKNMFTKKDFKSTYLSSPK